MTKKLNSMPDYQARLPKHPHDVSQSTTFSAAPGMLQPVYYDMLHLGDELHFSASEFVRLNPLEAQPLGQIDVHLDYFFVPLTVMYLPSSSLFYETDDLVSSVFASNVSQEFPVFDFPTWLNTNFSNELIAANASVLVSQANGIGAIRLPIDNFDCIGKSLYRMWDLLDMSPDVLLDCMSNKTDSAGNKMSYYYPQYTPWFALAYQAIYQLFFRNDDREKKQYHYNIDQYYNSLEWTEDLTNDTVKSIFSLNYSSRPKDYYNSVKVSPISSSVSLFSPRSLQQEYGLVNEWLFNSPVLTGDNSSVLSQSTNTTLDGSTSTKPKMGANPALGIVNTASIRQMFMVEKLLRVVGRAEKNYESQFLAHYGIKIPHDVMHNITHIGHDMITITPESVISSANTFDPIDGTGSALGEIGGKGSGMLSGRKHNFTAPFHGVFMCISHIVPRRRYVLGLNKLHDLSAPNKFWQPEFDQKGMQPLFAYEANLGHNQTTMDGRLGWQFAYEQYKRKSDRVTRCFSPVFESSDTVNKYSPWVFASYPFGAFNDQGVNAADYSSVHPYDLLVSPNDLNGNMIVQHNNYWPTGVVDIDSNHSFAELDHKPWLLYQTDPFICDFNMYCKKVNRMSEYGEPEL